MVIQISHKELNWSPKPDSPSVAVDISPDGINAISSGLDFTLRKWDLHTGECTQSWDAGGPLNAINIHPNGKWTLISTVMGALLWDLARWQFIRSYLTNYGGTFDIAYSDVLGMVIGAGEDSLIYRWDLESGEKYNPLTGHQYPVSALAVCVGSNLLSSGDSSGEIHLWELASGENLIAWKGHEGQISDLAVLPRTRKLLSAAWESPIKVWDLDSGEQLHEISGHSGWVHSLVANNQESWLLVAGENGFTIWDLMTNQCLKSDSSIGISCLALSEDNKLVISGGPDGSLSLWNIHSADRELGQP